MSHTTVTCFKCGFVNPSTRDICAKCATPLRSAKRKSPLPAAASSGQSFRRGQIIAGRYTILDLIGRGGMATIYKVNDNTLKETVALKTMLPQFTRDKMLVARFYNEARIARQLTHPNIVRVHDIGMAGENLYISMEYLDGRSLRAILDGLNPGQRVPIKTTLRIMDQLCNALHYAHQYTIHRDIKPENVMVLDDGTVKLMDFGISKLKADNALTSTSIVMGTPHYMSPEQLKDSRDVDARADVYSMGVVLYEMLTGNIPSGVPKPASQITREVPPDLDTIVVSCMEPDPISRYQTIQELRDALGAVLAVVQTGVSGMNAAPPAKKKQSPMAGRRVLGGVLALVVIVLTAWGLWRLDARRLALLETASAQALAAEEAGLPKDPLLTEYEQLSDWLMRGERAAKRNSGNSEFAASILQKGQRLHQEAKRAAEENDLPGAIAAGRAALSCCLGILSCPDDMIFVPPGTVEVDGMTVEVEGFYIEQAMVTNQQYAAFVDAVPRGWRPYDYDPGQEAAPAVNVTFYDAQMYAAQMRRTLPARYQWRRAVEVYPELMAGQAAVWTCTAEPADATSENADVLWFGARIIVCDAHYEDEELITSEAIRDFAYADIIGIRCVSTLPLYERAVEQILQ